MWSSSAKTCPVRRRRATDPGPEWIVQSADALPAGKRQRPGTRDSQNERAQVIAAQRIEKSAVLEAPFHQGKPDGALWIHVQQNPPTAPGK